jgi:hypothetical protein
MTLLRIFRNLAVLAILTVAGLSLNSRLIAAQSSCIPEGDSGCSSNEQCCTGWCAERRCCRPLKGAACTTSADCCYAACIHGGCSS